MAPTRLMLQPSLPVLLLLTTCITLFQNAARAQSTTTTASTTLPAVCAAAPLSVPRVPSRDQTPTPQALLGRCTERVEAHTRLTSSWCRAPPLTEFVPSSAASPSTTTAPTPVRPLAAETCAKRGRMTIYRGPVLGYEDTHMGACNATLAGSSTHALVAVSTAHLNSRQGGWEATPGACGSCMCVRVAGADSGMNPSVSHMYGENIAGALGASFMGVVGDRCGECEDEHIDILLDRPLSFAPYDRSNPDAQDQARAQAAALKPGTTVPPIRPTNRRAPLVNRLKGPRVFSAPASLRGQGRGAPEAVGVYVADWQWAPCEWTHSQCAAMWRRLGYTGKAGSSGGAWAPPVRSGVDSDTGLEIASPREDKSFCCGDEEAGVEVPEVPDALPEGVREVVRAAAAAAAALGGGSSVASSSAEDEAAVVASAALAASWAAGSAAGGGSSGNATGQQKEEEQQHPMYNAADEFAASFATGAAGTPSLLAARTLRSASGSGGSGSSSSPVSGAALLSATRPVPARGGGGSASASQGSSSAASKWAGIAVGAAVGAAALGATAWALVQRKRPAAAEAGASAASAGAVAGGDGKNNKPKGAPAFVLPPPPASGNGAEMGGR